MAAKQLVILKGINDGLEVWLDKKAEFEQIILEFKTKISDAGDFFKDANTTVSFKGRVLSDEEKTAILDMIEKETAFAATFAKPETEPEADIKPEADSEILQDKAFETTLERPGSLPVSDALITQGVHYNEYMTAFLAGGLRSGQSIRYPGSVVVAGDTNAGSEIIADGNVIVLGSLKGMVHAGAAGDVNCYVSALSMNPTQLRIANFITYLPKTGKDAKKSRAPSCAYIQGEQVFIAPL